MYEKGQNVKVNLAGIKALLQEGVITEDYPTPIIVQVYGYLNNHEVYYCQFPYPINNGIDGYDCCLYPEEIEAYNE